MFRHAGKSGAKIFDGVKVNSLEFEPVEGQDAPGRPISANWSKKDGSNGTVNFDYVVDASGRAGVVSTKYLKNRRYNQGLKNVASWGYWTGVAPYGVGTPAEGQPYFEALADASGWVWTIPLHNGITSVGVVMNQAVATARKKEMDSPSGRDFYLESLKLTPGIMKLLEKAELTSGLKSASDWSYSASEYASPHVRIAGDAGCFIDPFFSSGVHLAIASGLSAAVTICASMKGNVDENTALKWHSDKVAEGYTRFLLVVLSALKQIRSQDDPVLSDWDEAGFERAFSQVLVIQGTADVSGKLTQQELSQTVDFCFKAFAPAPPDQKEEILRKVEALSVKDKDSYSVKPHQIVEELEVSLTPEEIRILKLIQARQMLRSEDMLNIESFSTDVIDGMSANVKRGELGLVTAAPTKPVESKIDALSLLTGEERLRGVRFEDGRPKMDGEVPTADSKETGDDKPASVEVKSEQVEAY